MMPKYVRCIDNTWCKNALTIGKVYKVWRIECSTLQTYYAVKDDRGIVSTYYAERFQEEPGK